MINIIYLLGAIFTIALAFQLSPKIGGVLVLIYVLGMLYVAQEKGELKK